MVVALETAHLCSHEARNISYELMNEYKYMSNEIIRNRVKMSFVFRTTIFRSLLNEYSKDQGYNIMLEA